MKNQAIIIFSLFGTLIVTPALAESGQDNSWNPYELLDVTKKEQDKKTQADKDKKESQEKTWQELREMDEFDYPNRWDDLTLQKACDWISKQEFEEIFSVPVVVSSFSKESCTYSLDAEERKVAIISINFHVLGVDEAAHQKRSIEKNIASMGDKFHEKIETGKPDIEAYLRKDRGWINVFPKDGASMWQISVFKQMKDSMRYYRGDDDGKNGLTKRGERFLQAILEKYDSVL